MDMDFLYHVLQESYGSLHIISYNIMVSENDKEMNKKFVEAYATFLENMEHMSDSFFTRVIC